MKYEVLVSGPEGSLATIIGYREMKGETQMDEDEKMTERCKEFDNAKKAEPEQLQDGVVAAAAKGEVLPTVGSSDFKEDCFALRTQIEETKKQMLLVIQEHPVFLEQRSTLGPVKLDEMIANLTLSYRHLEDARMRLGKAIQAFDGGKSVYPR